MRKRKNTVRQTHNNTDREKSKGIYADILLLLFGLIAVFFLLSLFSYSVNDPGYSTIVFSKFNDSGISNMFGKTGAYTADFLGTYFGWTALFIPFIFIYISLLLFRYKKGLTFMMAPVVALIYGLGIMISLAIISGIIGGQDFYFIKQPAGGALGVMGSSFILSIIGKVGGIVVFICFTIAFAMLLFSVSFSDMGHGFRIIFKNIMRILLFIKSIFIRNKDNNTKHIENTPKINEEKTGIVKKFLSLFKRKEKDKVKYLPALPANNQDNEQDSLLNKDELEAISNIQFNSVQNSDIDINEHETIESIHYNHNEEIIDVEPVVEQVHTAQEKNETIIKEPYKNEIIEIDDDEEIEMRDIAKTEKALILNYNIPMNILNNPPKTNTSDSEEEMKAKGDVLVQKLKDFNVSGVVRAIQPGPVVTMFEFEPAAGTRIAKIASLESDLALSMSALSIRIIAPIPGKNAVGIEIPNKNRAGVFIKELLQTKEFKESKSPLTVALGKDSAGRPYMSDVCKMPHLLVAGTTGSGKSVGINTMICSILYKASPDEVKFIMIDPKMVELSVYDNIPHLLAPVVTDTRLASSVLKNVVAEMTRRYEILKENKARNIDGFNKIMIEKGREDEKMPYLVVIVDEFADLMMVAGKDVETSIARIAQMARAVGIHLIIATQRPTTNVITGLIKANMPARLAFKVSQKNDSRVIIDQNGADTLLGMGDSLFIPPGTNEPVRIHGAFVSDKEVLDIVEYLQNTYGEPEYDMDMVKEVNDDENGSYSDDDEDEDEYYKQAVQIAYDKGSVSISMIQRHLKIGYNRAARIVEMMERRGILEPSDGTAKPRKVRMI